MNTQASMLEMEEESKSIKDYINLLRRRKRLAAIVAATVMVIVVLVAFFWPPTYRSESIILIEQQDIPPELVQTTITSYAQERIEQIRTRIMTIGNIMSIVEEFELYSERELDRKTRTEIAREFRDSVEVVPISAEVVDPRSGRPSMAMIAFSLAYDGDVPRKVQLVANKITELFLDENLKERTQQTQSTSDFLSSEAELLSEQLLEIDERLARFKEQNKGALPENSQFNVGVVDRTELQITDTEFQLKELEKRKIQLEGDLVQLSPSAPVVLATGETVLGDADRLKALQSQLRQAEASYRDDHPTVQRLRSEIESLLAAGEAIDEAKSIREQLQLERNRLAELEGKYTADHPEIIKTQRVIDQLEAEVANVIQEDAEVDADNPAYLVLKTRLQATEEDIRLAKQKVVELRNKVERYEGYLSRAPAVEKDLQTIMRDYNNTYRKYQEIRAKQMSAELAKSLESERKGERFTLVQPPELPIEPVSPNRVALIVLGLVLSVGIGLAATVVAEAADDTIYGVNAATSVTGTAPLVVISYMETAEEASKHGRKRIYIVAGLVVLGIIALILFHYFVKPLDVTWYVLMRKLGIQ